MAIKMRNNKDMEAVCCECHTPVEESLGMFDVCIGGKIHTVCDLCNEQLFRKTLAASCSINQKLKSPQDMEIIRKRRAKGWR